jgi:hypothetical protein
MTGRAGRSCDFRNSGEDLGPNLPEEADVQRVREPPAGMPIQDNAIAERRREVAPELLRQRGKPIGRRRQRLPGDLARGAERNDVRYVLGACPPARLVATTVHERTPA